MGKKRKPACKTPLLTIHKSNTQTEKTYQKSIQVNLYVYVHYCIQYSCILQLKVPFSNETPTIAHFTSSYTHAGMVWHTCRFDARRNSLQLIL